MHLLLKMPSVQTLCYKEQHLLDVRLFTKMKNFIILGVNLLKKSCIKENIFLLEDMLLIVYVCLGMCLHTHAPHVCRGFWRLEESVRSPGARVSGG